MHLGTPRHQVFPGAVNSRSAVGRLNLIGGPDLSNTSVANNYRLAFDDAFAVHGDHVDVDKGGDLSFRRIRSLTALSQCAADDGNSEDGNQMRLEFHFCPSAKTDQFLTPAGIRSPTQRPSVINASALAACDGG